MSDKHLIEAENELSRLAMQSEQEKAMFVTLPARFNENMTAFEMFFPHLHAELKDYVPMRPFRFFCNENGMVTHPMSWPKPKLRVSYHKALLV